MPRDKRKNERIQTVVEQLRRNGYSVHFRGFPTFWARKEGPEGLEFFPVYVRRKFKTERRRDPMAGLSAYARNMIKHFQEGGSQVKIL